MHTGKCSSSEYSPPVVAATNGLSIAVPSTGGGAVFKFQNLDKNVQLALPLQINISRTGSSACFSSPPTPPRPSPCAYPANCPNQVFPRADKQSWMMNKSTIIMPCNNTGMTDPKTTLGWELGILIGPTVKAQELLRVGPSTRRWMTKKCSSSKCR